MPVSANQKGLKNEKNNRSVNLLQNLLDRKKATVKELQSLAGLLNFMKIAIFPGTHLPDKCTQNSQEGLRP